jgi:hypothetical protein
VRLTNKECYTIGDQIQVANGASFSISFVGHSSITSSNRPLYLNHILYAPKISKRLVSIRKLASDNDAFVELYPNFFHVKDRAMKCLLHLQGRCRNGLYTRLINSQAFLTSRITPEYWHPRLGHPASPITHIILQENNMAVDTETSPSLICNAC